MKNVRFLYLHAFAAAMLSAVVAVSAQSGASATTPQRPITESDLLKFVWIADPQVSPDGTQVAFVRVVVNEQKDDYETSIWLVSSSASR